LPWSTEDLAESVGKLLFDVVPGVRQRHRRQGYRGWLYRGWLDWRRRRYRRWRRCRRRTCGRERAIWPVYHGTRCVLGDDPHVVFGAGAEAAQGGGDVYGAVPPAIVAALVWEP
jgi:hypothetical protein